MTPQEQPDNHCDVLVVGGGPGGSSVATMLRKRGRSVILLEKEPHPRFHIGESLLPHSMELLRDLGVFPEIEAAGFVPKWGAAFALGDGSLSQTFYFSNSLVPGAPGAYQVLRSKYDQILLEHSRKQGADVREGHALKDVVFEPHRVLASVTGDDGRPYTVAARFLVDSTGQNSFLANKLRTKEMDHELKKIAVYGHFHGVRRDEGIDAGNTISIAIRGGWIWFIPLADDITSIGFVLDNSAFKRLGLSAEEYFDRVVGQVPVLTERMQNAERISPVRVTSDYCYAVGRQHGQRYIILGDAGFFLDPIFSSGVHLAMWAGVLGAEAVDEYFERGASLFRNPLARWQHKVRRSQRPYQMFVRGWYGPGFLEMFLRPTNKFQMVPAVVAVLAGTSSISWAVWIRMKIFAFLVLLNRRFILEERIDRDALPPALHGAAYN